MFVRLKASGWLGSLALQSGRFSYVEAYVQAAGFDTLVKTVTLLLTAQLGRWLDLGGIS